MVDYEDRDKQLAKAIAEFRESPSSSVSFYPE